MPGLQLLPVLLALCVAAPLEAQQAPVITLQDTGVVVRAGGSALLSATVTGDPQPALQWRKQGYAIPGATQASLPLAGARLADSAAYDLVAENVAGRVVSPAVRVLVDPATDPALLGPDPAVDLAAETDLSAGVFAVAAYGNGQVLIAGDFTRVAGSNQVRRIARLNADGSLDPGFRAVVDYQVYSILIQPDQKIVIGGAFTFVNGVARNRIARLNADGSLDPTFAPTGSGLNSWVYAIARQPADGKLVVGGVFTAYDGVTTNRVLRLNPDGSRDTSFSVGTAQGVNGTVLAIALEPGTGRPVLGGSFSVHAGGASANRVVRLKADGTLDPTFVVGTGFNSTVWALGVDHLGRVVAGGDFTSYNGTAGLNRIACLNPAGGIDSSFNSTGGEGFSAAPTVTLAGGGGSGAVVTAAVDPVTGSVTGFTVVAGGSGYATAPTVTVSGGGGSGVLAVAAVAGGAVTAVTRVANKAAFNGSVRALAFDEASRQWIAGGDFTTYNGSAAVRAAKFSFSGAKDESFTASPDGSVRAVAWGPGGANLLGGYFGQVGTALLRGVARVSASGVVDPGLAVRLRGPGAVHVLLPLPDGRILVGGDFTHLGNVAARNLVRLNPDLTPDRSLIPAGGADYLTAPTVTFVGTGTGASATAVVDPRTGRVTGFTNLVGGSGYTAPPTVLLLGGGGSGAAALATVTDGQVTGVSLVTALSGPDLPVLAGALQGDGRVVLAGSFSRFHGEVANRVVRLNPDLSIDPTFSAGAGPTVASGTPSISALELIPGGGLYAAGNFSNFNGSSPARASLVRLTANGAVDPAFSAGTAAFTVLALARQDDGRLVVGGTFTAINGVSVRNLARLQPTGAVDPSWPAVGASGTVRTIGTQGDGRLVVGGDFTSYNGASAAYLTRLNGVDGTIDPSFRVGLALNGAVHVVRPLGAGWLAFGYFSTPISGATGSVYLLRLGSDGLLDPSVALPGGNLLALSGTSTALAPLSDGSILVTPLAGTVAGKDRAGLMRLVAARPPTVTALSTASVRPGDVVTVSGADFTDVTAVRFNGLGGAPATFTVSSPTSLSVTVPPGASSGPVSVSTNYGHATSAASVAVAPDFRRRTPAVTAGTINSLARGKGLYVATALPGEILTSPDGVVWTSRLSSGSETWSLNSVTFGQDQFVAVGGGGRIFTSDDGIRWTQQVVLTTANFTSVVEVNGRFLALSTGATVATSSDARSWSVATSTGGGSTNAMVWTGGQFVAVGPSGAIRTSPDGLTWTGRTSGVTAALYGVAAGSAGLVAVGDASTILTSADGVTWTRQTAPAVVGSITLFGVTWTGTQFLVAGRGGVLRSPDGVAWTGTIDSPLFPGGFEMRAVISEGGFHLGAGWMGSVYTSVDGATWQLRQAVSRLTFGKAAYGAGRLVAISRFQSGVVHSEDGATWRFATLPVGNQAFNGIAHGARRWVIVGSGVLLTSAEGLNWEVATPAGNPVLRSVAHGPGGFIAVGDAGAMFRSADGITWVRVDLGAAATTAALQSVAVGPAGYVVAGAAGGLLHSADGQAWSSRVVGTTALTGVAFGGGRYVAVGAGSTVLTSIDGVNWSASGLAVPGVALGDVAAGDGLFVATPTGFSTSLYLSTDGLTWATRTLSAREFDSTAGASVSFANGRFIVGASSGNLLSTEPGATTFRLITQPAPVTVAAGQSATLSVGASGTGLSYQWYEGAAGDVTKPVAGAQLASFVTPAVTQPREYWVRVSSVGQSLDSAAARVATSAAPPVIVAQPQAVAGRAGETVTLEVQATSSGTLTYQWRQGGVALPGETGARLTLVNLSRVQADAYDVLVSDGVTTVTSAAAALRVEPVRFPEVLKADSGFQPSLEAVGGVVRGTLRLAGGKILVFGDFSRAQGLRTRNLFRLNADGSLDPTFAAPEMDGEVRAAVEQPNGLVVIGGTFLTVDGVARSRIARLNPDGTLQSGFNPGANSTVNTLAMDANGRIVAGGSFTTIASSTRNRFARLTSTGTLESPAPSFNGTVNAVVVLPDGSYLVGGSFTTAGDQTRNRLARVTAAGAVDHTFNPDVNGIVSVLVSQPDGKVVMGGAFTAIGGSSASRLARLNPDGTIDATFTAAPNDAVTAVEVQADGAITLGGAFTSINGANLARLARVTAAGGIDGSFAPAVPGTAPAALRYQADGTLLVGGDFTVVGTEARAGFARLGPGGGTVLPVPTAGNLQAVATVNRVRALPGGRVLVAGNFTHVNGRALGGVVRLNPDGGPDPTFNPTGAGANGTVSDAVSLPDGRVVIVGAFTSYNGATVNRLARLQADGSLDTSFDPGTGPSADLARVIRLRDGHLLVAGAFTAFNGTARANLARLDAGGRLVLGFNPASPGAVPLDLAEDGAGRILVAGSFTSLGGLARSRMARLDGVSGAVDPGFAPAFDSSVNRVISAPDGSIVAGGAFTSVNGVPRTRLVRLLADGSLDASFDPDTGPDGTVSWLELQEDGRLLVAGSFTGVQGIAGTAYLARLEVNGRVDASLTLAETASALTGLQVLDDGNLLLQGPNLRPGSVRAAGVLRTVAVTAPQIISQSGSASLVEGATLNLTVTVQGARSPAFQWQRDGAPIPGATLASLQVNPVTLADAGTYQLTITPAGGVAPLRSAEMVIGVRASAPVLSSANLTFFGPLIKAGSHWPLSLPALSGGSEPISYQWFRDGVAVPGATGRAYNPLRWEPALSGVYQVRVSNALGAVVSSAYEIEVQAAVDWAQDLPKPQSNPMAVALFAGGRFVVAGQRGTLLTSSDGTTWTVQRLGVNDGFTAAAYGNGVFVVAGTGNSLVSSADAISWTARSFGGSNEPRMLAAGTSSLTFGGGRFVAVGARGLIVSSTDGASWVTADPVTRDDLTAVAYGAGRFVALGAAGRTYTSVDGQTWGAGPVLPRIVAALAFGAGRFVAAGASYAYTSTDGLSWVGRALPNSVSTAVRNLHYTEVGFLATQTGTSSPGYLFSADGLAWSERSGTFTALGTPSAMAAKTGAYVWVGEVPDTLLTSPNGTTWTRPVAASLSFNGLAASPTTLVAVASNGEIHTSTTGTSWVARVSGTTVGLNGVAFGNGTFVAVGNEGVVLTSADGIGWTAPARPTANALRAIRLLGGLFYAVGDNGTILRSADGVGWTPLVSGSTQMLLSIAQGAGKFVVLGREGLLLVSADGQSWTEAPALGLANTVGDVGFFGNTFILVAGTAIRTSTDGVQWLARTNPFPSGDLVQIASHGGRFYAVRAAASYCLTSDDGVSWALLQHGNANASRALAAFADRLVFAGAGNSIISLPLPEAPPLLVSPPRSVVAAPGQTVNLSVAGTGPALAYQWMRDGVDLPGMTGSALALPAVQAGDAGRYAVRLSTAGGSLVTPAATVVVTAQTASAHEAAALLRGAVSVWRLDETSGPVARDVLARADGEYQGAVEFGQRSVFRPTAAAAVRFKGGSVRIPDVHNPPGYTYSVWLRPESAAGQTVLARALDGALTGTVNASLFIDSTGRFGHFVNFISGRTVTGSTVVVPGQDYHVVITAAQNGFQRLYVNGREEGTGVALGAYGTAFNETWIGAASSRGAAYAGLVDEVAFFDRELSPAEVEQLHAASAPPLFSQQPQGVVVPPGSPVTLSATTTGASTFQWRKDGVPLNGATGAVLSLPAAQRTDKGIYTLSAANEAGVTVSVEAPVYVGLSPVVSGVSAQYVRPGDSLLISGGEFADVRSVRFNGAAGAAAVFTVTSPQGITATVPLGAVSGPVAVETVYGRAESAARVAVAPDWQLRNPAGVVAGITGVVRANGIYVAVGQPGDILTSLDGQTWTPRFNSGSLSPNLNGLAFGQGIFAAVGGDGSIRTSSDGLTWTERASGTSANLVDITFGGGRFVAVSSSTAVVTSTDGVQWTASAGGGAAAAVAFGAGRFVSVGAAGAIRHSLDGIGWTQIAPAPTTANLQRVAHLDGQFVAVGTSGAILTSPDGIAWTARATPAGFTAASMTGLAHGGGRFLAVGGTQVFTSLDGVTWTGASPSLPGGPSFNIVMHDGTRFVAAGRNATFYGSTDGINWTLANTFTRAAFTGVAYGNGRYVAVSSTPAVAAVSGDGISWSLVNPPDLPAMVEVAYGAGTFTAIGSSAIHNSADGLIWTNRTPAGSFTLRSLAHGAGRFVVVGNAGLILVSAGGVAWERVEAGITSNLLGIAHGPAGFVAVGSAGAGPDGLAATADDTAIYRSGDGVTWSAVATGSGVTALNGITYGGGLYVAVGAGGKVLLSGDGATWTAPAFPAVLDLQRVAHQDGIFVATNASLPTEVHVSTDGSTWSASNLTRHVMFSGGTVFAGQGNGRLILLAGSSGQIVSSNPGPGTLRILNQPAAKVEVPAGISATLTVSAGGTGLGFQWYEGISGDTGKPVSGANGPSLITAPATRPLQYWVRVSSGAGSVDSATSTVTAARSAPVVVVPPQSVSAEPGQPVSLSVTASGAGALSYQWRRAGVALAGATGPTLAFGAVTRAEAGLYDVVVSDAFAATVSASATLRVLPASYPESLRVDPAYRVRYERAGASVSRSLVLPDGKLLVSGEFSSIRGVPRLRLARLNADDSVDATFTPPSLTAGASALAVAGAKLLVAGSFSSLATNPVRSRLIQLESDGTLDATFNPGGSGPNAGVSAVAVLRDAGILIGGDFTTYNSLAAPRLARLSRDGLIDLSFNAGGAGPNSTVTAIAVLPDERILIAGAFTLYNGLPRSRIALLNPDGSLDPSFDPGLGADGLVRALVLTPAGQILLGGDFLKYNGLTANRVARLNADASLDTSFAVGSGANGAVHEILFSPADEAVFLGGAFTSVGGVSRTRVARLLANGSIDTTFSPAANSTVTTLALQAGRLVAGGAFTTMATVERGGLAWIQRDGALDVADAGLLQPGSVIAVVPAPGGRMLVGGDFIAVNGQPRPNLLRLLSDGSIDPSFTVGQGPNGPVYALHLRADGRLLLMGSFTSVAGVAAPRVARLLADGSPDPSFSPGAGLSAYLHHLLVQADGKIILLGRLTSFTYNGVTRYGLVRLLPDGELDSGFVPPVLNGAVEQAALLPDGRLVVGGSFTTVAGESRNRIVRLLPDGRSDPAFAAGVGFNGAVTALAVQPDERILASGAFTTFDGAEVPRVARLEASGALDTTFDPGVGPDVGARAILPDLAGRLLLRGPFSAVEASPATALLARLTPAGGLDPGFALHGGVTAPGSPSVTPVILTDNGGALYLTGGVIRAENEEFSGLVRLVPALPVTISTQPQPQRVAVGGTATFSVGVAGSGPFSYQWYKDGLPLRRENGPTLVVANVQAAQAGDYSVVVGNVVGSVSSQSAALAGLNPAPTLLGQLPARTSATAGVGLTLTASATGAGPLKFQWFKSGQPIAGATAPTFSLPAPSPADQGFYSVRVSDGLSAVVSATTLVEVAPTSYPAALQPSGQFAPRIEAAGSAAALVSLADGRFLAAGNFVSVDGVSRPGLARFTAAGLLDASYQPAAFVGGTIQAAALQADGKLILGGSFTHVGGVYRPFLVRLNPDGSVDPLFSSTPGFNGSVSAIAILPDGRIAVGGSFSAFNGVPVVGVARLTAAGGLDASFSGGVSLTFVNTLGLQPDGMLVVGGTFGYAGSSPRGRIARLRTDGSLDPDFAANFGFDATVNHLLLQPDGRILVGGSFTRYGSAVANRIVRLLPDGSVDPAFATGTAFNGGVNRLALLANGDVVAVGAFTAYGSVAVTRLARLSATGGLDADFNAKLGTGFNVGPATVAVRPEGGVLAAGSFTIVAGAVRSGLARLAADGSLEDAVDPALRAPGTVHALAPLAGGRWLIGGSFSHVNNQLAGNLACLSPDGGLDAEYLSNLGTGLNGVVHTLLVQPDGAVVAGGTFTTHQGLAANRLARFNADGTRDLGWSVGAGFNGAIYAAVLQPNGRIVVGGAFTTHDGVAAGRILRLLPDGTRDPAFNPGAGFNGTVSALSLGLDGRLLVGGATFSQFGTVPRDNLAILNPDGSLVSRFNPPSAFNPSVITDLGFQPDGTVLATGLFSVYTRATGSLNSSARTSPLLVRLTAEGELDLDFSPIEGRALSALATRASFLTQADGKVVISGAFEGYDQQTRVGVVRLSPDGSADPGFGAPLVARIADASFRSTLAYFGDGRLIVTGQAFHLPDRIVGGLMVFEPAPAPAIHRQPDATTVQAGQDALLTVSAVGPGAPTYQWFRNGVPVVDVPDRVEGAATSRLRVMNAQASDAGSYRAAFSAGGTVLNSLPATLTVVPSRPAAVLNSTLGTAVQVGSSQGVQARITAGSAPVNFQWLKDGSPLPGASGVVAGGIPGQASRIEYLLSRPWSAPEAGRYSIRLTNALGSVDSASLDFFVSDGPGWRFAHPSPAQITFPRVQVMNGKFVALGSRGIWYESVDGANWTQLRSYTSNQLSEVLEAGGRRIVWDTRQFALAGANGSWAGAVATTEPAFPWVVYGAGHWLAAGRSGTVLRSPDAINWTPHPTGAFGLGNLVNNCAQTAAFGNGRFLLVAENGVLHRSPDGISWQRQDVPSGMFPQGVAFLHDRFVLFGSRGALATSLDGVSWTAHATGQTGDLTYAAHGAGWYLVGGAGTLLGSTNGTQWTPRNFPDRRDTTGAARILSSLAENGGTWLLHLGRDLFTSTDLERWTRQSRFVGRLVTLHAAAAGAGRVVAVGDIGEILHSADLASWSAVAPVTSSSLYDVTYAAGSFYAVGSGGGLVRSTDGVTWTLGASGTTSTLYFVGQRGSTLLAAGTSGALLRSTNGAVWSSVTTNTNETLRSAAYGAGRLVVVGSRGLILSTADDLASTTAPQWTQAGQLNAETLYEVVFARGQFVVVGGNGSIHTSSDGLSWTDRSLRVPDAFTHVQDAGDAFVVSGGTNLMVTSRDGVAWSGRAVGYNGSLTGSVVWGNRVVGVGGTGNVVMATLAPEFDEQPADVTAVAGTAVELRGGAAASIHPVSYQWRRDGQPIPGATAPTLRLENVQAAQAGGYSVVISNPAGSQTSRAAAVGVASASFSFSPAGGSAGATVVLTGEGLASATSVRFGTAEASFTLEAPGRISAVVPLYATSGRILVQTPGGTLASASEFVVSAGARLPLLTTLNAVGTGERALLGNFAFDGPDAKEVLIRAIGPSLPGTSGTDLLPDPVLTLFDASGQVVATNDDWGGGAAIGNAVAQLQATPFAGPASKDAALLLTLPPGTYAVRVTGKGSATGKVLLEVHGTRSEPRFVHLASRAHVAAPARSVTGFSLVASGADGARTVLIRAVGQPLLPAIGALANPSLRLFQGATELAANDDWGAGSRPEAITTAGNTVGALPLGAQDAAILVSLVPGEYVVESGGGTGSAGFVLTEIFVVDGYRPAAFTPALLAPVLDQTAALGAEVYLAAPSIAKPAPLRYEWSRNGVAVAGGTVAGVPGALRISSLTTADLGAYSVTVTNAVGSVTSPPANIGLSGYAATQATASGGYQAGGTVTVTQTLTFTGPLESLGWQARIPSGWSYLGDDGSAEIKPAVGAVDTLEWAWITPPLSPATFSYRLAVPAAETATVAINASVILRLGGAPVVLAASPASLTLARSEWHSADSNRNFRIALLELTRVIELFNVRFGGSRTGAYSVNSASEDGFAPDASRSALTAVSLTAYHSADLNRDGRLNLLELTRVIELYNYRAQGVRTGDYHLHPGSEDGFNPGPAHLHPSL